MPAVREVNMSLACLLHTRPAVVQCLVQCLPTQVPEGPAADSRTDLRLVVDFFEGYRTPADPRPKCQSTPSRRMARTATKPACLTGPGELLLKNLYVLQCLTFYHAVKSMSRLCL